MKNKLNSIIIDYGFNIDQSETMRDLIECKIEHLKENQSYATNTINELETAKRAIYSLCSDIECDNC